MMGSEDMDSVKLKNGDTVPKVLVAVTMLSLESLMGTDPIAFYELVESCRDRAHVLFGSTATPLMGRRLIDYCDREGRAVIHDAVRSIVLSATTGDGLDLTLTEPIEAGV